MPDVIVPDLSRRNLLRLAGLGALGLTAACAPSSGGSDSGTDSGAADAKAFQFLAWSLSEEKPKPVLTGIVDGWKSKNGVDVTTAAYPYDEYLNQLTLQTRGGKFAGVAQLDVAWLGALSALGKLADLGEVAGKHDYTETALASGQVAGKQLALPWVTGSIGLLGNDELMKAAGVTAPPATIEEFEEALRKIKAKHPTLIPYAAMTNVDALKDILTWMQAFGSPLVADGKVTIGDDASVQAITWYKKLYDAKLIAPDVDRFAARTLFSQGKAVMYDDAIIAKGVVTAKTPVKDLAAKLLPMSRPVLKSGDDPAAVLWGHLAVVVDGDGSAQAKEFASYLTGETTVAVDYFTKLGLPPTTGTALKDPAVTADTFTKDWTERITATAKPSPFWTYPQYAQMESTVAKHVQSVLVGKVPAADAMAAAGKELQELVA